MKAILEFNLPEDQKEFEYACNGSKCMVALFDINQMFRSATKHRDPNEDFKTPFDAIDKMWSGFHEILNDSNIPKEEI
jgi:hypothetical protein